MRKSESRANIANVEADRGACGLCRYSKLERYGGLPVFKALKVSVAILNLI